VGIAECHTKHLEKHIDRMFALYSPVPTYTVVDSKDGYYGLAPAVIRLPENHVTPFSSDEAEYQFWATLEQIKRSRQRDDYDAFCCMVTHIMRAEQYNDDVADTIEVLNAVVNGVRKHAEKFGRPPLDNKLFIAECMEYGLDLALE
jgi:hypothetical protein